MRRLRSVIALLGMVVAMTSVIAGPASADTIFCRGGFCTDGGGNDTFFESPFNDRIIAGGGDDDIFAQFFRGDRDFVSAGKGRDFINTRDGDNRDTIRCGKGRDVVRANKGDNIANNCERVR